MSYDQSYDQLIEWIDIHTDEDDYKSKDTLVKGIKDDWKGSVKLWVENEGFKPTGKSVYDEEIQTKIDSHNDEYINKIQDQILSANRKEDIESISPDTGYEPGTAGEIESLKREAAEHFGEDRDAIQDSIDKITSAISDTEDLGKMSESERETEIRNINKSIEDAPSVSATRKLFPDLANALSDAQTDASTRVYDLEHAPPPS